MGGVNFASGQSSAKGDIQIHNGTTYTRLGVGSNTQVLTADSTQTTGVKWSASGGVGAWSLIDTATASSDTTIEFNNLSSSYAYYVVTITDCVPVSDGQELLLRTSTNNGVSFDSGASDYRWSITRNQTGSGSDVGDSSDSQIDLTDSVAPIGSSTNEKASWVIWIADPSAASFTDIFFTGNYIRDTGSFNSHFGGGQRREAVAVDAIQFLMSSGNIESGEFRLYGVTDA